tara:strand:+ start:563 stop:874 length:312 start_codon:yes stop_codon:yes gene_type:complete
MEDTQQLLNSREEETNSQDIVFEWVEMDADEPNGVEVFAPPYPTKYKCFYREKTEDMDRTQYDLFFERVDEEIVYGMGCNLYAKQCNMRIRVMLENSKGKANG